MEGPSFERQSLLPRPAEHNHLLHHGNKRRSWQTSWSITLRVLLALALISFADQLAQYPQTRIFESVICYTHYEETDESKINLGRDVVGPGAIGGVDEKWCKIDAVQNELALLGGYLQMFDSIPNLLLAMPFGWYADRFGRRSLMLLNLVQLVLTSISIQFVTWFWQSINIRMVWISAFFSILGGGPPISSSLFFVVLSDVTSEPDRAAIFLRAGAINVSANIVIPPLAAWLMTVNPWIPFIGSTGLLSLGVLVYLTIPETLGYCLRCSPTYSDNPCSSAENSSIPPSSVNTDHSGPARLTTKLSLIVRKATIFLVNDWRIPALIVPFCGHMLIAAAGPLILQYLSKRYTLTFAQGTLLIAIRNGMNVLSLLVIVPRLSTLLTEKHGLSDQRKDLYLARVSQILVAIGWTLFAASPNWPLSVLSLTVSSLGQGSMLLLRSFLASLIPAHHIATTYSIISMWDAFGTMVGAPFLASLFRLGSNFGHDWVGLPFYIIGMFSALFACLLFVVRLHRSDEQSRSNRD